MKMFSTLILSLVFLTTDAGAADNAPTKISPEQNQAGVKFLGIKVPGANNNEKNGNNNQNGNNEKNGNNNQNGNNEKNGNNNQNGNNQKGKPPVKPKTSG